MQKKHWWFIVLGVGLMLLAFVDAYVQAVIVPLAILIGIFLGG